MTTAVDVHYGRGWEDTQAKLFALFPVIIQPALVLRYNVVRNGLALPRDSWQEITAPGDCGIYVLGTKYQYLSDSSSVLKTAADRSVAEVSYKFTPIDSYSSFAMFINENAALTAKVCICV
jgi:hypothetical protein